jgi:hypothetical protein
MNDRAKFLQLPPWSEDDYDRALAMWRDRVSARQIAIAFGNPAARNTVIGRIQRRIGRGHGTPPHGREVAFACLPPKQQPKNPPDPPKPPKTPAQLLRARRAQAAAEYRAMIAKLEAPKLTVIDNPAFVAPEPEPDLYAHMRSEDGYCRAVAALTVPARSGKQFHG